MLISFFLSVTIIITTAANIGKIKESATSSTTLENLLLELVSAYENGIRNEGVSQSRPSKVFQRRNISQPEESHTLKYSFSIRGSLDNLKSPVLHLYKGKKKTEPSNRTETARYKLLTKRTNEEFIGYLDRLIEGKTKVLRAAETKITEVRKKIGKTRLQFDQKMFQHPKDKADLIAKLSKKESQMRSQLTERLNTYLASASNLILPFSSYSPFSPSISNSVPFHVKSRSARKSARSRRGRSVDTTGSILHYPFLQKPDLKVITSLIWEGAAVEKPSATSKKPLAVAKKSLTPPIKTERRNRISRTFKLSLP